MNEFWNKNSLHFQHLPEEGRFRFEHFLLAVLLVVSMFVGFGQIPFLIVLLQAHIPNHILLSGDTAKLVEVLSETIGKNTFLVLQLFPFVLSFAGFLVAIKWIHKSQILRFFTSRSSFDWGRVGMAFGLWALMLGAMFAVSFWNSDNFIWKFEAVPFFNLLLISFLILPLQTTCEELLFRSYFFKAFSFMKRPILQLSICGILFGAMHLGNPEIEKLGYGLIVFYIWTGIFLGLVAYFDNGIELTMGYHAANNIFASIIVTSNWQAFQTDALWLDTSAPAMGWDLAWTLFVCQPLLFLFFRWKYKWKTPFFSRNQVEM